MGQLAERHGRELRPAGETLGGAFGLVLVDRRGELRPGKMLQKLIEQAGSLYHDNALLEAVMEPTCEYDPFTTLTGGRASPQDDREATGKATSHTFPNSD